MKNYVYTVNHWFGLVCFLPKNNCLIETINGATMRNFHSSIIYFYLGSLSQTMAIHRTVMERKSRYIFTVLHLSWLTSFFKPSVCNCQTLTWQDIFPLGKLKLIEYLFSFASLHKKMKFSIKDFFSKGDQIRSFLRIFSHLLKKSLMESFSFCAVLVDLISGLLIIIYNR